MSGCGTMAHLKMGGAHPFTFNLSCSSCSASYYELTVDSTKKDKQKSSGLAIFTGSGSTAWAYNINRVTPFQVGKILRLGEEAINSNVQSCVSSELSLVH